MSTSRRLDGDGVRAGCLDERLHELGRRVDLADAGDALVGVDADDEVVLAPVGDAVVHDRLPQDDGLDVGDLHGMSPDADGVRAAGADCQDCRL